MKRSGRSAQGSASVEVVVMLPVFVALFVGVHHLYGLANGHASARQAARACAWQYALAGCVRGAAHDLCVDATPARGDAGQRGGAIGGDNSPSRSVFASVERLPLVGAMVRTLFGESMHARAVRRVSSHDAQARELSADTFLLCNTVSEGWSDKIEGSVCDLISSMVHNVPFCP